MNIIRKHWGILLCGIVFLGLLGYLLFSTFKERQAYAATQASIQEQQNWFKNVNKDGWRIKKSSNGELENASIAERNREMTVGRYQEVTEDLYRRYAINPELPPNASRAREMLDQQLGAITDLALGTYRINFGGTIGGKLAEINQSDGLLTQKDYLPIFRQLQIYSELIRHIGRAGIKSVTALDFPRSLQVEEGSGYTITPITLTVEGTSKMIQTLINNLSSDRHMLFFLRNISLFDVNAEQPASEFTQVALIRREMLDARRLERLGGGTTGGLGTGDSRGSRRGASATPSRRQSSDMGSSRRTSRRQSSPAGGAGGRLSSSSGLSSGMDGLRTLANLDESLLAYEEPKRQDNFVFRTPRTLQAEITLDLIEFNAPEAE